MATSKKAPVDRLTAAAWVRSALEVLSSDGLAAVAVEPLARRLGVTKGSFYWHFRDRQALIEAMLESWEKRTTEEGFYLDDADGGGCRLSHVLDARLSPRGLLEWPLLLAPVHDWALEALFDRLEIALTTGTVPESTTRPMSRWAALCLRWLSR